MTISVITGRLMGRDHFSIHLHGIFNVLHVVIGKNERIDLKFRLAIILCNFPPHSAETLPG